MAVVPGQQNPATFQNGVYNQPQLISNQIAGNSALPQVGQTQSPNYGFAGGMPQQQPQMPQMGQPSMNNVMSAIGGAGMPTPQQPMQSPTQPQQNGMGSIAGLFGR